MPRIELGYHPPSGVRGLEVIRPRDYLYDLQRALDVAAQSFPSLWVSDHLAYGDEFRVECWTHLAWIAARYPGPKLGTVVLCNSFRHPALLAKMAASLQFMSQGRLILGYGAGWYEPEHRAFGFDFPPARVRIEMLEEAVQIIRALWRGGPTTFSGKHYRVEGAYCTPQVEPPPVLMIGAGGERYALRVVARYADWWNDVHRPVEELRHKLAVLRQHCAAEGRDFASLRKTLSLRVFLDRSHQRAQELARERLKEGQAAIVGDPAAVREQLAELAALGFDYLILSFPRFQELDDLKLFVDAVQPAFS